MADGRTAWGRNLETPLRTFLRTETSSAAILLIATVVALVWVNIDAVERYVSCPPKRRNGRWKRARTTTAASCSFCGRPEQVAGRLVAGPGVYICPACVALSTEILNSEPTA